MEKKSFVRTMNVLLRTQILTVSGLLIFFVISIYLSAARETNSVAENFLNIYAAQIENRIQKMNTQMSTILSETGDLLLLEDSDEAERYYASWRLSETMKDIMRLDQSADIFVVAEVSYGTCLEANNGEMLLGDKQAVKDFFMDFAETGEQSGKWEFQKIGGENYLYKAIKRNQRVVAAVVSVESLLNTIPDVKFNNCSFILTDTEGMIEGYAGAQLFEEQPDIRLEELPLDSKFQNQISLADSEMILYSFGSKWDVFHHLYGNAMLILIVIVLLFLFDFGFMKIEKTQLLLPMGEMVRDMEKMEAGDYEHRVAERGNTKEFSMLAGTFNKLMDEILHLKIQFYEKKLALSDAEQKYIRLQIRPHFFLNAMTTISSLSAKGKNAEIEAYINALSKNIRYMFSSGLHTVPVKEEIRHVENYFEMQELRYPDCLFYFISMPKELEEWKVPQMLIHTLIENEYKYAVSQDSSLMVLIKISTELHDGEEMLIIEVEDDGKGYPQEVLEYMNHDSAKRKQDGSRVGLWSVKRLLELMYDREGLMEISNVQPHGAMNRMYIPREPVNERSKEFLNEHGIQ